jgi:YVTN family beta-propeller protein
LIEELGQTGGPAMKRRGAFLLAFITAVFCASGAAGQEPGFRVLAFYSANTEPDHVQFAEDALKFFGALAGKEHLAFEATSSWEKLKDVDPKKYRLVVWLNGSPSDPEQRQAFQKYMETGGAWMGFHAAGYNDKDTNWPWFVDFLGGAVFYINSWPPLPAKLVVSDRSHAVTSSIPDAYVAPSNEWYVWKPSPRLNPDVQVLLTLDPTNYPLGLKDIVTSGDLPVAWTNRKYKMVYMNMGHGDRIFTSATQNKLIENATLWLGSKASADDLPEASGLRVSPHAVEVNPKTNKVYAVNRGAGTVTVIDGLRRAVTSVKVERSPTAIAVNPVTNKIYVGNEESGSVSVIDGATDTVTATVKVGDLPYVVTANPFNNKVYVSKTFSDSLTVIDGTTNTVTMKEGMQADAVEVIPRSGKMFLVNYESAAVAAIDVAGEHISAITVLPHSWGIGVNPATSKIYLGTTGGSNVAVIDGASNAVGWVHAGKIPCAFAADPGLNRVYVANYASNDVTILDGPSNAVIATIKVGEHPQAIAVNPLAHVVFVTNTHSNSVTVINGTNNTVAATVHVGGGPYAIAVDSAGNKAYVVGLGDTLTAIDGKTLKAAAVAAPAHP